MNKKPETHSLDIPKDDIECWDRYPKHRWVYDLSRLLDAQHIKWSPYKVADMTPMNNIEIQSIEPVEVKSGVIYINKNDGNHMFTEVYIAKGEIRHMRHFSPKTGEELTSLIGEIDLRLNAFVTLYFSKFTGVITAETYGNEIYRIQLRPKSHLGQNNNIEIAKLIKKLYKKNEITINGLTDQDLHDILAS